jgi:succinate dehydrogenase / fumarate reductase cytochrome b subunit
MLGNLQVFAGPQRLNAYAALLKSNSELLWGVRVVLLIAVIVHIFDAAWLAWISHRGRPVSYYSWRPVASTLSSRTMRWSGPIIGLFIVYHLLHLTTGTLHPDFRGGDVYHNVVTGFRVWYAAVIYLVGMFALGMHLYHGTWSMFQSAGVSHPKYSHFFRKAATFFTFIVVIGFISIPIAVLLGFIS